MRNYIDNFVEFSVKLRKVQVIISYDCSDIHDPFAERLRSLILEKYDGLLITKSNYLLGKEFSFTELESLDLEIKKVFEESQALREAVKTKQTKVIIIIPDGESFEALVSIDESI